MCHGNGYRQETTRLHVISFTKTGWRSLTHNRVLHQALARSLCENKVQFAVEDIWPFRERLSKQNGRLNPLGIDLVTEAGTLFDDHPPRQPASWTTILDARIRRFYSTLPSLTLAPAPIWRMENVLREKTSPTQLSGRKISIGVRFPLPTPSFLLPCRRVVSLVQTCMPSSRSSPSDG